MNHWLSHRYLETIKVLREDGLWNLDDGLILLPYIQHCLPPPNLNSIRQSMSELILMGVDTDWFPLAEMKRIHKKIRGTPDSLIEGKADQAQKESIGHDYPIHYGIRRICSQRDWSVEIQRLAVVQFIEFIYKNTGPANYINPSNYYSDVYSTRDVYICLVAKKYQLPVSGQHRKGLQKKLLLLKKIRSESRWVGNHVKDGRQDFPDVPFWENAPEIPYRFIISSTPDSSTPAPGTPPDSSHEPGDLRDLTATPPSEHENLIPKLLVKWARQNVRSEADAGALSWGIIFRYWEFLLTKSRMEQFLISVLALATGIPKKRWQSLSSDETALKQGGLVISLTARHLVYKVQNIASDFSQTPADKAPISQCLQLAIPSCWQNFFSAPETFIAQGIKEESSLRGYSRKYGGVTPTINRMARSGHALLRREFLGELRSHILSGNIPIELQNRSAYQAVSNQKINEGFQAVLQTLVEKPLSNMSEFPRVHAELQEINKSTFELCSDHLVGSQLSAPSKTLFKAPKLLPGTSGLPLKLIVADLNQLELYYFWMQQFAMADRAVGELTGTTYSRSVRWHRDKDSHEHEESKIHLAPDLLLQQFLEVQKARSYLQGIVATYGQELTLPSNDHRAMVFKVAAQNKVKDKFLDSKTAQRKAEELWGYQPPYGRRNAHRHRAATWMAEHNGEIQADILLGHHVDGWDLFAPESSASMNILKELKTASDEVIVLNGFKLLRSPWQ